MTQRGNDEGPQLRPGSTSRQRDEELLAQGWTRRFVGAPPRLKEVIELYRSLGYQVHLEAQEPDELDEKCKTCVLAINLFRVVYTRPLAAAPAGTEAPGAGGGRRDRSDDNMGES